MPKSRKPKVRRRRGRQVPGRQIDLVVDLGLDTTHEDILEQMRRMRNHREKHPSPSVHVQCTIRGYNEDARELYEIPEVKVFARRLIDVGFISYLDVQLKAGLGWTALDVWLCAEGLLSRAGVELTKEVFDRFTAALHIANTIADHAASSSQPQLTN